MITDERTATYIDTLTGSNTPFLEQLNKKAVEDDVPVIRRQTQSLIKFLLSLHEPERILEIGTAVGFSSIFMATYGKENLHIDTIENYEKRIKEAKINISESGFKDRINLIEGDAQEVIEKLLEDGCEYDMIFVDAAKAQYINYLPVVKKLLKNGGILLSDNVLFDGDIVQSRFAVRRRDRTIHARIREYLRVLSGDEDFVTTILPVADGMTLSVKK